MLKYALISDENGVLTYAFYPEGNEEYPGIVAFHPDGKREIIKKSEADPFGMYKGHALHGITLGDAHGVVGWC